jgi:hypothetical protein
MDYLVLRKTHPGPLTSPGATLRGLWHRLSLTTVVELKTLGSAYRTDDLDRLWAYVHLLRAGDSDRPPQRSDLRAVLVVPARTPTLIEDVDDMGLRWKDLGRGYWQLKGGLFTLYVVELDVVCEQEDDDFLRAFTHRPQRTLEGKQFWARLVSSQEVSMALHEMEEYDEVIRKLLSTLTPEQRLAGLAPEQRLADLVPEQVVLALPDEVLRGLTDEYIASLSEPTRAAIRRRLGR